MAAAMSVINSMGQQTAQAIRRNRGSNRIPIVSTPVAVRMLAGPLVSPQRVGMVTSGD